MEQRLLTNNVIMVVKKDVLLAKYNLAMLVFIVCTHFHSVTKTVEMELGLTLSNVIMGTRQVAQLIVK
jgi:hypothetical protein